MIDHLLSSDGGIDFPRVTASEKDFIAIIFTPSIYAMTIFDLFQIVEDGTHREQFLVHGTDDADFHKLNPLVVWFRDDNLQI